MFAAALLAVPPAMAAATATAPNRPESTADAPVFVRIPPISLPVIEGGKVTRQIGVNLMLELADGRTAAEIEPKRRRLRDAFIRDLYGIYQVSAGAGRPVNEQVIKARLHRTAAAILGPDVVREVLIQQLLERPRPP